MIRVTLALVLGVSSIGAMAQMTPVGLWKQFDDKDGKEKAEMRIVETAGVVSGKIEKRLDPAAKVDDKCTECSDDRKNKPIVGLEIIRGAKKVDGKDVWESGKILDPGKGKDYTLRLTPIEGGKKLEVRGSFLGYPRTQTWSRIQ